MPTQTNPAVNYEVRGAGYTAGGIAATNSAKTVGLPINTQFVSLEAHNSGSSATVVQFAINPWITVIKTADSGATWTDYSENAQDDDAATDVTMSSLDTLANGDALFVGCAVPTRGLAVDVDAVNGTASLMTGDYWDGSAWSDITETDGTADSGAALGQDGSVTWTEPSDWESNTLGTIIDTEKSWAGSFAGKGQLFNTALYWVRLKVSAALDSSTTLNSIHPLNRSIRYGAIVIGGQPWKQMSRRGFGGFGSIEFLTDTGTADLVANTGTGLSTVG
jgi:hypothetical protein